MGTWISMGIGIGITNKQVENRTVPRNGKIGKLIDCEMGLGNIWAVKLDLYPPPPSPLGHSYHTYKKCLRSFILSYNLFSCSTTCNY